MAGHFLRELIVRTAAGGARFHGLLVAGGTTVPCALGRTGLTAAKREGDGGTPRGTYRLTAVLYRPDRGPRPRSSLPVLPIAPSSGWCDDPRDHAYNQPVELPYPASAEHLWRDDHLYDVVIVLDYNMHPAREGAGSAIFLHIATPDFSPTAGCVAVSPAALRRLLPRLGPATTIRIA